jgi:hypothetical protein
MVTIIAGSRSFNDYSRLLTELDKFWDVSYGPNPKSFSLITKVISGGATGADALGEKWAKDNNIELEVIKAHWSIGKHAGKLRNIEMANKADRLIAFWDGMSPGTAHMIATAIMKNLDVYIYPI